jgi:hypothetical protein
MTNELGAETKVKEFTRMQAWESGKPGLPKGSAGWVRTQLNLAGRVNQRVHRRILYTKPEKTGYPTVPSQCGVFETRPGGTQRSFTRVKPVYPARFPSLHE